MYVRMHVYSYERSKKSSSELIFSFLLIHTVIMKYYRVTRQVIQS